jgi:hypothetical protein
VQAVNEEARQPLPGFQLRRGVRPPKTTLDVQERVDALYPLKRGWRDRRPRRLIVLRIANPTVTRPRGNRLLQIEWKAVVFSSLLGTGVR